MPPSRPLADLTRQEAGGHAVFQPHCASCHYANTQQSLCGPGPGGLYKRAYLPSGAPANDGRIAWVVEHGRNMMPAFANDLDDKRLNELLAYLHTL